MKKLIFSAALVVALGYSANSQNSLEVSIDKELCLDEMVLHYSDNSSETVKLGCEGTYKFDTGSQTLAYVTVNGTDCYEGETKVKVNDGQSARLLESIQDESRSFVSIIR